MSFQGSKLLEKMGYIPGQGLGKNNEGTTEPVSELIEANKGRSQFGLHKGRKNKIKSDKKVQLHDSEASDTSEDELEPKQFDEDLMEVDEKEGYSRVAKRLLASNEMLIQNLANELRGEVANLNLLKKSVLDLQRDVKKSEDLISSHKNILEVIDYLEAISRNDRLEAKSLWYSLPSDLTPKTKSHMIQVFALPLLRRVYSKVRSSAHSESIDTVDLESKLFSDMIDIAREWLKTKSCYPQLISWYQEWMETFRPYLSEPRVKYFRRRLLDVMYLATLQNQRDLNSFKYIPYDTYLKSKQQDAGKSNQSRDKQPERDPGSSCMNFRQFVEYTASEHGLLFRPHEGRSHDSKQLYKLEKLSLYISDKVIYCKKNDQWIPKTMSEVVQLAQTY